MGVTSNWCHPQGHHARRPPTTVPSVYKRILTFWLSMACNTDMLSKNMKLFLVKTFTYFKALLITSTSAVKYFNHLLVYNPLFHKHKHMQTILLFLSLYTWQQSKYFCFNPLNRLLKTVEEVDDLSNSDRVKSTVTSSESQKGTTGILLIAISPNIYLCFIQ